MWPLSAPQLQVKEGGTVFFRESCFRQSGDRARKNNPTHYRWGGASAAHQAAVLAVQLGGGVGRRDGALDPQNMQPAAVPAIQVSLLARRLPVFCPQPRPPLASLACSNPREYFKIFDSVQQTLVSRGVEGYGRRSSAWPVVAWAGGWDAPPRPAVECLAGMGLGLAGGKALESRTGLSRPPVAARAQAAGVLLPGYAGPSGQWSGTAGTI